MMKICFSNAFQRMVFQGFTWIYFWVIWGVLLTLRLVKTIIMSNLLTLRELTNV